MTALRLILASASPRRLELLARLGVVPDAIAPADIDETPKKGELPLPYAERMAAAKAAAAAQPGCITLGADTVVAAGRRILPKADDEATARRCLELLSGRRHRVHSAVTAVRDARPAQNRRLAARLMAEWLLEHGIGEDRAILVEDGAILEAAIELPTVARVGSVVPGRLTSILQAGKRGIVTMPTGGEALMEPLPKGVTEGAAIQVEVVREAVAEGDRTKLPKVKATEAPLRAGSTLAERIGPHRVLRPNEPDLFEAAGWSELIESALSGEATFPGGALRISLTPAMTLFDVDGALEPAALAVAGAAAAGRAIRRFGIGGSIGIDLPTLPEKADRQAAAAALDAVLPQPFERTAVNGFGFLQVVRRRERPSLPELLAADRAGAAARVLLRRGERVPGGGALTLVAPPAVAARLAQETAWIEELGRRTGGRIGLRSDERLPIFGGYVHQGTG
jgi:hypothetical protein